jgi:hypothetical protein
VVMEKRALRVNRMACLRSLQTGTEAAPL